MRRPLVLPVGIALLAFLIWLVAALGAGAGAGVGFLGGVVVAALVFVVAYIVVQAIGGGARRR